MARSKKAKHIANVLNSKQPKADMKSSFYGLNVRSHLENMTLMRRGQLPATESLQ